MGIPQTYNRTHSKQTFAEISTYGVSTILNATDHIDDVCNKETVISYDYIWNLYNRYSNR